jgi:ferric-dicitrate binding protein FerR (iron transport regulator)
LGQPQAGGIHRFNQYNQQELYLFNPQLLKQRISGSFEVNLLKHRLELVSRLSSTFSDFVAAQRDMQKQILFNSDNITFL